MQHLPDDTWLSTETVFHLLCSSTSDSVHKTVPRGRKECCYCVIDNKANVDRRNRGQRRVFDDDCGEQRPQAAPVEVSHSRPADRTVTPAKPRWLAAAAGTTTDVYTEAPYTRPLCRPVILGSSNLCDFWVRRACLTQGFTSPPTNNQLWIVRYNGPNYITVMQIWKYHSVSYHSVIQCM